MTYDAGLEALEREVMKLLLTGDEAVLALLRDQYAASEVVGRETTGAGFFTNYRVPEAYARVPGSGRFTLTDVQADIEGLKHGAGFVLYVREGRLDMLEGYSYEENWPGRVGEFHVQYTTGAQRDLSTVRKRWA